jgi:hypothetical protein
MPLRGDEGLIALDVSIEAHVGAGDTDDVEAQPPSLTLYAGGENPLALLVTEVVIGK